ncbi:hypothetical protein KCP77_23555 [Salmonella enterica subsp. enterica]|nr:hypothetical protein KCP77_23555 [Salmonella enterica subsp. enterica]
MAMLNCITHSILLEHNGHAERHLDDKTQKYGETCRAGKTERTPTEAVDLLLFQYVARKRGCIAK